MRKSKGGVNPKKKEEISLARIKRDTTAIGVEDEKNRCVWRKSIPVRYKKAGDR
jgi:hypothetical protein